MLDDEFYLSDEERNSKRKLVQNLRISFQLNSELTQNKCVLESESYDFFQELRFKIDQHREELKQKIDDFA